MKVALVIIYNHKYEKNISLLDELYQHRFSNIYHLVPFYEGSKDNVIAVYENSFYFQGYIAQARQILESKGPFDHYFFIGDDVFLNPEINEKNYNLFFHIEKKSTSFLPSFIQLDTAKKNWGLKNAIVYYIRNRGLEIADDMPSYAEIIKRFKQFGLREPHTHSHKVYHGSIKKMLLQSKLSLSKLLPYKKIKFDIPLVGGYSDLIIISGDDMKLFSHYCGLFAASKLFVELAIPTAMVMACNEIVTEDDMAMKGLLFWGKEAIDSCVKKFHGRIDFLVSNFPSNTLYIHPIKFSKWEMNKHN